MKGKTMNAQTKTTEAASLKGKRIVTMDELSGPIHDPELFQKYTAGDQATSTTEAASLKGKRVVTMDEPNGPIQDPEIFQKYPKGGYIAALDTATAEAYSRLPEDPAFRAAYDKLFKKHQRMARARRMAARHCKR